MYLSRRVQIVLLVFCGVGAFTAAASAEETASTDALAKEFASPGPEFRGAPFWSWNGTLTEGELKRQIDVLKTMGMGAFFMHSRTGLATEYLGEEWFRLINACADYGAKENLGAWLYDEDRWPSGTAGGMVTKEPKFRAKVLRLNTIPAAEFQWKDDYVAVFAADLKDNAYTKCVRLDAKTPPETYAGLTVAAFDVINSDMSEFFNGYTYVDTINREATDYYLNLTHEQYAKHCGDRLGKSIKGIFCDEPHRGPLMTSFGGQPNYIPWTFDVAEQFQKRYGYDLIERLPELYFRKDNQPVAQVKWQFAELLQSMFLDNWAKPIHAWCKAHNLLFTGHVLHEDSMASQVAMQGSLMRFYECMDWPGVDVLTEGNRNYWIVKQVASAARQLGQKHMLSELYGVTGWQFNFESHKYVGDWQALFGINLRCHHLSWYTMAGEAKRDYPASIFYQSAWWKDYAFVESYYARLGTMLAQGRPACDVLVVNPIESVWCQVAVGWCDGLSAKAKEIQDLEGAYVAVFNWLIGSHIDFDYGDEEMLSRLYKVDRDPAGKPVFCVGQARYRVVVLPKMTTIRSTTLKLLEEFRQAGGKIVLLGAPPEYVDAVKSPAAAALADKVEKVALDRDALVAACKNSVDVPVEIVDASGKTLDSVFCQLRIDGQRRTLAAMSMDREKSFDHAKIRVKTAGHVAEWDCTDGRRFAIDAQSKDGWIEWTTDFAPIGQRLFVITDQPEPGLAAKPNLKEIRRQELAGPFDYRLGEPNVCVLDLASYRVNDEDWKPELEVLKVDRAIRKGFGMPNRGGGMVQPWYRKKFGPKSEVKGRVGLRFEFHIDELPQQPVSLALEQPQSFRLAVNGKPLSAADVNGWWVDPAIKTIPIPASHLVKGANSVELAADFQADIDIEALYLLGQFGVKLDGTKKTLTKLPEKIAPSDLIEQGLPFYSGPITYRIPVAEQPGPGQRLFVETPKFEAACIKVVPAAEGQPGIIAWQPYRAEVGNVVANGVIDLEVVLTRRNTFGPLHLLPKRAFAYGPDEFLSEGAAWSQDYQILPSGLLAQPVLSVQSPQ